MTAQNFQLRYGGNIAETDVETTSDVTFGEGTTVMLSSDTGKFTPVPSNADYVDGIRFIYTGYISTRPDVVEVGKVKAVYGPSIIETDVISGALSAYSVGMKVAAKNGKLKPAGTTTNSTTILGEVISKGGTTITVQIWK